MLHDYPFKSKTEVTFWSIAHLKGNDFIEKNIELIWFTTLDKDYHFTEIDTFDL